MSGHGVSFNMPFQTYEFQSVGMCHPVIKQWTKSKPKYTINFFFIMVFWNLFSVLLQGNLHPITHQNMTGFHSDHILTGNTINLILMWLYDVVKKFHIMGFQHCHPTFEFEWTFGKLLHLNIPWCISTYWKQICFTN